MFIYVPQAFSVGSEEISAATLIGIYLFYENWSTESFSIFLYGLSAMKN
jgi:hypothetical protein